MRVVPDKLETLRRRHDAFRALLQIDLTVLATAHAVSEGMVPGRFRRVGAQIGTAGLRRIRPGQFAGSRQRHSARRQPYL